MNDQRQPTQPINRISIDTGQPAIANNYQHLPFVWE